MNSFKNSKKTRVLLITALCCAVIAVVIDVSASISNKRPEPDTVRYTGSVGSFSVDFTRFTDYDAFLEAKSSDILIYDSREEMQNPPGQGYLAGVVGFNGSIEFKMCKLELIRESGWNTSATPMNMVPGKEGPADLPFITYDFSDSSKNIYKTAIIRFEGKEVVIPLTKSSH